MRLRRKRANMATCALVGAVEFNAEHFASQSFDFVVAVDGGYAHLEQANVVPDLVIGDFDSLGYVPEHPRVETHPSHKDASDIELAMERASEAGFETLVVYGCMSGRLDHTVGMLQLLGKFAQQGLSAFAIGDTFAVTALSDGGQAELQFSEVVSGTLSAFALTNEVTGVDEVGLEYPLAKATLTNIEPLGVSNEFTGAPVAIAIERGTLLVFFPLEAWDALQ